MYLDSQTFMEKLDGVIFFGQSNSVLWIRLPDSSKITALESGLKVIIYIVIFFKSSYIKQGKNYLTSIPAIKASHIQVIIH